MNIAYLDKKFIPLNKAKISVLDRGFLYGDGVFETMRFQNGRVFLLEKHIERLYKSLKLLNISLKIKPRNLEKIVYDLLDRNKSKSAYIKVIVTRGKTSGLLAPKGNEQPSLIIYTLPYKGISRKQIKACIAEISLNEESGIAGIKSLNYLSSILCVDQAKKKGFDDVIFLNTKGFVSEASSSNVFLVKRNVLFTPSLKSGCLAGVTRGEILRLAKRFLKNKAKECLIKKNELYKADEVFLTNSLVGVMPVVKIDNRIVGDGKPGPVTKKMEALYYKSAN